MAENENRVSAVQEAPDSPQEPAALDDDFTELMENDDDLPWG